MHSHNQALKETAYHEAGHAVLHHHFGHRLGRVTIVPTDDALGRVKHFRGRWTYDVGCGDISAVAAVRMQEEISTCYAGQIAERHLGVRRWRAGACADGKQAADLAARLCGVTGPSMRTLLRWRFIVAENLISSHRIWQRIEFLAARLLKVRTLTGEQTHATILEAMDASLKQRNVLGGGRFGRQATRPPLRGRRGP
jgi:hypothetical protein